MNKIYLTGLLLILIFLGCSKNDTGSIEENQNPTAILNLNFQVEIKNDMLSFPTREDYDLALEYLGPKNSLEFERWEAKIGFKSLRNTISKSELEQQGIQDDLLATLLNPDGMIEINSNIFQINMQDETVLVLNNTSYDNKKSFKNGKHRIFSTEDNVLDVLEGKELTTSLTGKSRYCGKRKLSWDAPANILEAKIVYQKAGILNSLQSKIQQSKVNIFNLGLKTNGGGNFWRNKKHSGTIGPYETSFFVAETKSYRPYYSSRRLKAYRFSMEFRAQDKNYSGTSTGMITKVLTIDCN